MVSGCFRTTEGPICRSSPTDLQSARMSTLRMNESNGLSPERYWLNKAASSSRVRVVFSHAANSCSHCGSGGVSRRPNVAATLRFRSLPLFESDMFYLPYLRVNKGSVRRHWNHLSSQKSYNLVNDTGLLLRRDLGEHWQRKDL